MSLHKRTFPEQEQLTEQLIAHGLEHKTPSQLEDAFRLGWQAALGLKTKERAEMPPGMVLVPIEPTPEMMEAAMYVKRTRLLDVVAAIRAGKDDDEARRPAIVAEWQAMLAASQDSAKENGNG